MSIKLSILICTMPERRSMLEKLLDKLEKQMRGYDIDISIHYDRIMSIGSKRNSLMYESTGEYICFIDDDDDIADNYIELLMEGINKGVDCCSLKGIYTVDGNNPEPFEHSIKYDKWDTIKIDTPNYIGNFHRRYPNHLNCIRADIAKQFKFPEINHGEDKAWSDQIHESGLLKTEHYIEQPIYYYKKVTKR